MIRVLHVFNAMGCGGAETLVMNLYRQIDREKVQFDFVVHTDEERFYDEEIYSLGGRIFRTRRLGIRTVFTYGGWWRRFFQRHPEFGIVHGHMGSTAAIYLAEARRAGAFAIAHSHNDKKLELTPRDMAWMMITYPTRFVADYFLACSMKAAVNRFGRNVAHSSHCKILKNSIDARRFRFNPENRERSREELGAGDRFVVGHVGRFMRQKNHAFLIDIFAELKKLEPDAILLLVGEGELEQKMRNKCKSLGIADSVIFAGIHENVEDYYAAMDVFCFPSLWEGFGNVVLEAQTNGLPCVASTAVPADLADMGAGLLEVMDLSRPARAWAESLARHKGLRRDQDAWHKTVENGFDSRETARWLQRFYLKIEQHVQSNI